MPSATPGRSATRPSRVIALAGVAGRLIDLGEPDRAGRLLAESRPLAESLSGATSGGRARASLRRVPRPGRPGQRPGHDRGPGQPRRVRPLPAQDRPLAGRPRPGPGLPRPRVAPRPEGRWPGPSPRSATPWPRSTRPCARQLIARARARRPLPARLCPGDDGPGRRGLRQADGDRLAPRGVRPPGRAGRLRPARAGAPHDPAAVAAALLPVAERIDPRLVPELFWRAVSLHAPRPVAEVRVRRRLALLLARYDRSVALAFFEPLADRGPDLARGRPRAPGRRRRGPRPRPRRPAGRRAPRGPRPRPSTTPRTRPGSPWPPPSPGAPPPAGTTPSPGSSTSGPPGTPEGD